MKMNSIYAYEDLPDDLEINGFTVCDWVDLPEINRVKNGNFSFYGVYHLNGQNVEYLKEENYLKAMDEDGKMKYFKIGKIVKNLNSISINALAIGHDARHNFIPYSFVESGNGRMIMSEIEKNLAFKQPFRYKSDVPTVHQFTIKETNPIDAIIGSNNGNQNLVGVTGGVLDMDNLDLILRKRIGSDRGFRIDFGINLESIEEEIDPDSYYNSLYLVGGIPETDYDEDKQPIVYKYLEIEGVTDKTRRIGKRENSNITDIDELIKWGQSLFDVDRVHEPSITHTVSMVSLEHTLEYRDMYKELAKLHFGDTVTVHVKKLDLDIKEEMIEYTWFPTLGKYKNIVLGNDLSMYTANQYNETQQMKAKIENRTESLVQTILNATSWITGNSGGHVVFRPEKAPQEILIMDTDDVATAKRVWRWNLNGLGYSSNGINGPFGTAMTSNGEIVADFIKVGILSAIDIEGVNIKGSVIRGTEIYGSKFETDDRDFRVRINDGRIQFLNAGKNKELGAFSPSFANNTVKGYSLTQHPGFDFSIGSWNQKGTSYLNVIEIPSDSHADNRKLNLYGSINIDGKLTINGKEVVPGSSGGDGGNWNGTYPDGLTDREKRYWTIWAMALDAGFTPQAAAALCGNAQGESDANPKADEGHGAPGYGYGIFQWTDSTGANSGRIYMINKMTAGGIAGDPDTIETQMKLMFWDAPHNQWIASNAYPYTWNQFMTMKDINLATQAFVANYERPLNSHPERTQYATYWYNKFVNLKPAAPKWNIPVKKPFIITSWYGNRENPTGSGGQFHKGIDFAANVGDPVYASRDGKVVYAQFNNGGFGYFVCIDHGNGLFSNYAHNSGLLVNVGDNVKQGQQIARAGSTGDSSGPHVHFAISDGLFGNYQDPAPLLGLKPN